MSNDLVIRIAEPDDLTSWMELVKLVSWNFPGLETEEALIDYQEIVIKNIQRKSALCVKSHEKVVGILLFSVKSGMLSCLAVHPDYRRKGIATKLIELMLALFPDNCNIVVSTFRDEDEKGIAPRALYKKFGFTEGELCFEFGYPNQKFILHKST